MSTMTSTSSEFMLLYLRNYSPYNCYWIRVILNYFSLKILGDPFWTSMIKFYFRAAHQQIYQKIPFLARIKEPYGFPIVLTVFRGPLMLPNSVAWYHGFPLDLAENSPLQALHILSQWPGQIHHSYFPIRPTVGTVSPHWKTKDWSLPGEFYIGNPWWVLTIRHEIMG